MGGLIELLSEGVVLLSWQNHYSSSADYYFAVSRLNAIVLIRVSVRRQRVFGLKPTEC